MWDAEAVKELMAGLVMITMVVGGTWFLVTFIKIIERRGR